MNFCEPGRPYKDIGAVIEDHVTKHGYKVSQPIRLAHQQVGISITLKISAIVHLRSGGGRKGEWGELRFWIVG